MYTGKDNVWTGKDILREGVWCLRDINTPEYQRLKEISQSETGKETRQVYGLYVVYFYSAVVFLFLIKRSIYYLLDASSGLGIKRKYFGERYYFKLLALTRWIGYRKIPLLFCNAFQLPSSLGSILLIMVTCVYMLCHAFIPNTWYRQCMGFGLPPLAVRGALESTALFPIIIILSGKTNIISQVTNISYDKLNAFHRWTSIMCFLFAWIHAIPYYYQSYREGGLELVAFNQKTDKYFQNGIPPIIFLTLITVFSHSFFRTLFYEIWLKLHWIFALGMYISLFIHICSTVNTWKYLVATVVFWLTQLFWQTIRKGMWKFNQIPFKPSKCQMRKFLPTQDNDVFEIIVENNNNFTWSPGQHCFITLLKLKALERHPFSIVSCYDSAGSKDIKLIVKACGSAGFTRVLYNKIPETGYADFDIFIDGPYGGCPRPVEAFESIFLIATGTGISAILPFLTQACQTIKENKGALKFVRLYWVIRNLENVEWILPELSYVVNSYTYLLAAHIIEINIFAKEGIIDVERNILKTLKSEIVTSSSEAESKGNSSSIISFCSDFVNIHYFKPSGSELIKKAKEELCSKNIFLVSGSDSMKKQVSNSVADLQSQVFKSSEISEIYLHTESFGL